MGVAESWRRPRAGRIRAGSRALRLGASLAFGALLCACAAGPDFQRPEPPLGSGYLPPPIGAETPATPGIAQRLVQTPQVSADWWRDFRSPKLAALIDEALQNSPTLAQAQARLRQSREQFAGHEAATTYPRVGVAAGVKRQTLPGGRPSSLHSAELVVEYRLDLSGGHKRALEALAARADVRRMELQAARLTLAAGIALAAVDQASLVEKAAATDELLRAQEAQLQVARQSLGHGQAAPAEVLTLQTRTGELRASLARLHRDLEQSAHLLATLAGKRPDEPTVAPFTLADLALPADLPLIVPSDLVRRRPDIRAAEALLHAASADHGVAVSRLYPQLNLSASVGSQALSTGALFGGAAAAWSLLGQLTQPLFDPALPADQRAALAGLDAAGANYRTVVLDALRNVADVLRAVEHDAQAFASLETADLSAQAALETVRRSHALGTASYVELLIAVQDAQRVRIDLIGAHARRLANSVALYQAMGGAGVGDEMVSDAAHAPSGSGRPGASSR